MALIHRIGRLFRADIHDLLDRVEEPAVVLRQALRDMEEELRREEKSLQQLHQDEQDLTSRVAEAEQSIQEISDQLELCLGAEKDDLARVLIRRRLELNHLQKQSAGRLKTLQATLENRTQRFREHQVRMEEVRQKAEWAAQELPGDEAAREASGYGSPSIRDEDVEVALLKEKQKWSRRCGE